MAELVDAALRLEPAAIPLLEGPRGGLWVRPPGAPTLLSDGQGMYGRYGATQVPAVFAGAAAASSSEKKTRPQGNLYSE